MEDGNEYMFKGFTQLSKSYYGEDYLRNSKFKDEITFGLYSNHGGTTGEMVVDWILLDNKYVPKWTIFDDAWKVLSQFHDLIDFLGEHNNENTSPEEFRNYLIKFGFKDITKK